MLTHFSLLMKTYSVMTWELFFLYYLFRQNQRVKGAGPTVLSSCGHWQQKGFELFFCGFIARKQFSDSVGLDEPVSLSTLQQAWLACIWLSYLYHFPSACPAYQGHRQRNLTWTHKSCSQLHSAMMLSLCKDKEKINLEKEQCRVTFQLWPPES